MGCELLSKIIIFVTRHNKSYKRPLFPRVVNCFQKLLSSWHDTTSHRARGRACQLWIAFKNYYLRDTTQLISRYPDIFFSCELLSKIIIFVTRHNVLWFAFRRFRVVNCFQKLLSSWHDTTVMKSFQSTLELWIAFKNYYLRDTTQPKWKRGANALSCELLSKIIIFVTRHNIFQETAKEVCVVNCFQKLLSSWHDTT